MASLTQTWETVGKSKIAKASSPQMNRNDRKKVMDNMPRIESKPPVEESSTIYDVFIEKDKPGENQNQKPAVKSKSDNSIKKSQLPVKKKKQDAERKKNISIDEAASQVKSDDLKSVLVRAKTSFPDHPDVWMKDLASYLNLKFENVPENDPVFKNKPSGFPLSKLDKSSKEFLTEAIKDCKTPILEHLYSHCMQTMLNDLSKGASSYGYRIFLQILAYEKPDIIIKKLQQNSDLLKAHQNRVNNALSILWATGQAGVNNIKIGLRIWINMMQPLLNVKALAPFAVDYLQTLLSRTKSLPSCYNEISVREYFQYMDNVHSNSLNIPGDLKKKLQDMYPQIKSLAYGENPDTSMRIFFPSYLSRTTQKCNQHLKAELMRCLVECLKNDKQCYSVWCQMYTKHLPQTSILLNYILKRWGSVSQQLDTKSLKETLRSFSVTNDELVSQNKSSMDGLKECSAVCKDLLEKMSKARFPWKLLILLLISMFGAIIAYDIFSSPNVRASRTVKFLDDYGIIVVVEHITGTVSMYGSKAYSWVSTNIPVYYAAAYEKIKPHYDTAANKTSEYFAVFLENTRTQRIWLYERFTLLLSQIYELSPETWESIRHYFWLSWHHLQEFLIMIWGYVFHIAHEMYLWIDTNFISGNATENLQRITRMCILTIRHTAATAWNWSSNYLAMESN